MSVAALLCTVAALAAGPSAPTPAYSLDVVSVSLYPVVRMDGRYVTDLEPEDFLVLEDGVPMVLDSFAREATSLNVVLLLDVSGSMADKLPWVKDASARFLDQLRPEDRVTVVGVSHEIAIATAATTDHGAAREGLAWLRPGGGTALLAALDAAAEHLVREGERNVFVLFSDGRDQSRMHPQDTADRLRRKGVLVFTLALAEARIDITARRVLLALSEGTGGESLTVLGLDGLDHAFDRILADLRAQYRLSYSPPPGPPGERRIEVRVLRPHHRVRCRDRYVNDGPG